MPKSRTMIDMKKTGQNIRRLMIIKGLNVKDLQRHLGLATPQSIYHWFDGRSLPTVDNLYALSDLFCVTVDSLIIGNREMSVPVYSNMVQRILPFFVELDIKQVG
jgi:transcriptional regulator with XRE-family HTH domain